MLTETQALQWAKQQKAESGIDGLAKAFMAGYALCEEKMAKYHRPFPTAEQLADIKRLYVPGGISLAELADYFQVTENRLRYVLRKHRIGRRVSWTADNISFLREHARKDMTTKQLAEHFGTTLTAVESAYNNYL